MPGYARERVHPLEKQFGLSSNEILDLIGNAFRLTAAVRGGVAELYLKRYLESTPGLTEVTPLDEDGRPDFSVRFRGRVHTIECKNTLRRETRAGPRVDFQKTRASKGDPCSRYYERDGFDLLAACLHPVTERWEFRFHPTTGLKEHPKCPNRLSPSVVVSGPGWVSDVREALSALS